MEIMRRFLVLAPVAVGVGAVVFLVIYVLAGTGDFGLLEIGLGLGLAVVVLGIVYAGIAASVQAGDPGFDTGLLLTAAGVQIPTWLTFAAGLLIGGRRRRTAQDRAPQDHAAQDGVVSPTA